MPNLRAHIDLAHRAAERLAHPTLDANMGCFLFGSTSPDIRVITRRKREVYHFALLDFESLGSGIEGLFAAHPGLKYSGDHNEQTRAFVCGYLTHLIVDESWIVDMYRPYFGNPEVFGDSAKGNVYDRALQLELDRQSTRPPDADAILSRLPVDDIEVGFIPTDTLQDWRDWVVSSLARGFTWERLRFMAGRISRGDESHPAHALADDFVRCAPSGLASLYGYVPQESLDQYRERSVDALVKAIEEYLP